MSKANPKATDIRDAAREALSGILEPLAGFILDSGLSTQELVAMFRTAAVKNVAARQLEKAHRVNISGIAASTGIPRAEISRILARKRRPAMRGKESYQQSTNRILARWHDDPQFTNANGQPADLKIFGRGATFESLAKTYGKGLPLRAMLDELVIIGAVELRPSQKVRAKTSVAIDRGVSLRGVKAFGDRASELLVTLLKNMRNPENPQLVANIEGAGVPPDSLPLFRKELSAKTADFLTELQDSVMPMSFTVRKAGTRAPKARVSVTVYYNEASTVMDPKSAAPNSRKNLNRADR